MTFGTAMVLLLSFCSVILGLGVIDSSWRIFRRWRKSDEEERYELEKDFYLTYSVVCIVLGIRLLIVPLYFSTMQALIPMIPGAMCLWGVFNALPEFAWPALFLKLSLPAIYIGWLMIARINSTCKRNPLMTNLMGFYVIISPLLLADSIVDILIFLKLTPVEVSCCSSAIDVGPRPIPTLVGDMSGQTFLLSIFFLLSLTFATSTFMSKKHKVFEWITAGLTFILTPILILTMTEVLTPWILHLPLHHCPFCLLFQAPFTILFLALFWLGIASPWWTLLTKKLGRVDYEAATIENHFRTSLWTMSGSAVIVGLSVITVHLLLAFT